MIRVYFLPVETIDGVEQVAGIEFIHDALLEFSEDPMFRILIMDTTDAEHASLVLLGHPWVEAPLETVDLYNAQVIILPPDPDTVRAQELLTTSPQAITMPEMWELMRIFGRRLGLAP